MLLDDKRSGQHSLIDSHRALAPHMQTTASESGSPAIERANLGSPQERTALTQATVSAGIIHRDAANAAA